MLKLVFKNLFGKPLRLIATVLAAVLSVAVIFSVLSFDEAVYDYLQNTLTAESGEADIKISYGVGGARIFNAEAAKELLPTEYAVGALSVYGSCGGEYIKLRGINKTEVEKLRKISIAEGKAVAELRSDDAIVSEGFAAANELALGSRMEIEVLGKTRQAYVAIIAKSEGFFDEALGVESVISSEEFVSGFFSEAAQFGNIYNELYIKLKPSSVPLQVAVDILKASDAYSGMLVEPAVNYEKLKQDSRLFSAAMVVVGAAAIVLALSVILFLAAVKQKERSSQIAKLKAMGARNNQLFMLYALESLIIGAVASALGLLFAKLSLGLIFKSSFGAAAMNPPEAANYAAAFFLGLGSFILFELLPFIFSFKKSVRATVLESKDISAKSGIVPLIALSVLLAATLAVEFTVDAATAVLGFVNVALIFIWLVFAISALIRLVGKITQKSSSATAKIAAGSLARDRNSAIKAQVLAGGLLVCILLMLASDVMNMFFSGYLKDMAGAVIIKNADDELIAGLDSLEDMDGVDSTAPLFWQIGELGFDDSIKSVQILGLNEGSGNYLDFEYITERAVVEAILSDKTQSSVILDISYQKAYGVKAGDKVTVYYGGKEMEAAVGGFVRSQFYVGNYVLASGELLADKLGVPAADTVIVHTSDADFHLKLRERFSGKNYFIIPVAEIEASGTRALQSIFDFVGTVTYFVAAISILGIALNIFLSRMEQARIRTQLLSLGCTKARLFSAEMLEYFLIALAAFVLSFGAAILSMRCLFDAVLVFGLYYEFAANVPLALVVGGIIASAAALLPAILMFPKSYSIKIGVLKVNI
ncbi:MAG: FtsX-like permease family protein [Christensenellales bacterium]|jgi:ABC-type lipoprotein release transport system permease subunit|nr:hypothetical protein [Eubacteriales bacterium]